MRKQTKSFLSNHGEDGALVLRGSNVTMYVLRAASQGDPLYLNVQEFMETKGEESKAQHSRQARIGFQRSSPQNNFRRLVSCPISEGEFCFDTVSYVPYSECQIRPRLLLALLNSKLLDWYFRLGSTNSKINEYQFNNLPCPIFSTRSDLRRGSQIVRWIQDGRLGDAFDLLAEGLAEFPVSRAAEDAIVAATNRIIEIERARGRIARRDRAALAYEAQIYQDFIDRFLSTMAGVTESEAPRSGTRLAAMM
jgi:hypothetical protein